MKTVIYLNYLLIDKNYEKVAAAMPLLSALYFTAYLQ
jgi:hypothetical protein